MKILLTGKNGQLGFELQRTLSTLGHVDAVDIEECDLSNEAELRKLIQHVSPDIIVNPAAYTAVDKAESDLDLAYAINATAPKVIAEEAKKLNAFVIHYSTDYVFDGLKTDAYEEIDETNPLNIYGKTKLAGEQALITRNNKHIIMRTSWVVGAYGANFTKTMLRLAAEKDELTIVSDQFGAPTSTSLLADVTAQVIWRYQYGEGKHFPYGLYHVTAGGETNWCDYARYIVKKAADSGKQLKLISDNIKPIKTEDYPTAALRPKNSRLDCSKFKDTFGIHLPHWQRGLDHILTHLLTEKIL